MNETERGASEAGLAQPRRAWLMLAACVPVAITCALVPLASLRTLGAPLWLALAAAITVFPVLPLLWHLLAERRRSRSVGPTGRAFERLALRFLAVGLVVLAVSLGNLGPRRVGDGLAGLVGQRAAPDAIAPAAQPVAPVASTSRHELEPFIPADAGLVVAMSGAAVMQSLLASLGADTRQTLTALQRCQILTERAQVLIAARDAGTRMMVVRAPGITDQRNLYCVVGFLGNERLSLRFASDRAPVRFEIQGLLARPVKFQAVDAQTVIATEGSWQDGAHRKLLPGGDTAPEGPLAAVLGRVDRGASLWAVGVTRTEKGSWNLALDARSEGAQLRLRGSSVPPTGEQDRAEIQMYVPVGFASALPQAALENGLRGVMAVLGSAAAQLPPPAPPPAPKPSAERARPTDKPSDRAD